MNSYFGSPIQAKQRHKVFVSYHHANDQIYRDKFEYLFSRIHNIFDSWSVQLGEIDPNLQTETVRQKIRDEYLRDSTVTVVLVGNQTWQRKHIDWEISSSIRDTIHNPRSGLLGIMLPTYRKPYFSKYDRYTIPPRLHDNIECSFAEIYDWSDDPSEVSSWIHKAFLRRNQKPDPDNSYPLFSHNRSGERWY